MPATSFPIRAHYTSPLSIPLDPIHSVNNVHLPTALGPATPSSLLQETVPTTASLCRVLAKTLSWKHVVSTILGTVRPRSTPPPIVSNYLQALNYIKHASSPVYTYRTKESKKNRNSTSTNLKFSPILTSVLWFRFPATKFTFFRCWRPPVLQSGRHFQTASCGAGNGSVFKYSG